MLYEVITDDESDPDAKDMENTNTVNMNETDKDIYFIRSPHIMNYIIVGGWCDANP